MENKNLYEILGLNSNATKDEIKISFRKLVRIYHPDINPTKEAEVYFKLLNNAVDTLLDDIKRSQYDAVLGIKKNKSTKTENKKTSFKKEEFQKAQKTSKENAENYQKYSFNEEKKDEKFFRGKDIVTVVQITQNEAVKGTTRKINILHTEKCPKCLGRKFINGAKCSLCKGIGESSTHKKMGIKIPKNVKEGTKIKLEGMGEPGKCGEANGDLYLLIQIEPDVKQRFEGKSIVTEVSISPYDAVLGTTLKVPVEGGAISIKIPPLTKSMTRFKLMAGGSNDKSEKNRLLENLRSDYVVVVKVDIPDDLSEEEINLYKKLKTLREEKSLKKSGEIF